MLFFLFFLQAKSLFLNKHLHFQDLYSSITKFEINVQKIGTINFQGFNLYENSQSEKWTFCSRTSNLYNIIVYAHSPSNLE